MGNRFHLCGRQAEHVALNRVDLRPGKTCMSHGFPLSPLVASLESQGLLNAPILRSEKGRGALTVVCGYRRLLALAEMGVPEAPCRILSPLELGDREAVLLNFYDNLATRSFNEVEKAMALARLVAHHPREEVLRRFMPLLGLPSHAPTLDLYLRVEEDLDEPLKDAVAGTVLPLQAAGLLLTLEKAERNDFFAWAKNFKFNKNQWIQLTDMIIDLMNISGGGISQITAEIDAFLARGKDLNAPQRARRALQFLRAQRNPSLTSMEKSFQAKLRTLELPHGVRIEHPPGFESTVYRMEVRFENGRELIETTRKISHISGLEDLCDVTPGAA